MIMSATRPLSRAQKLLCAAACSILVLTLGYFLLTSGFFFKSVILPCASRALGVHITVADASISPFSRVYLSQVKVAVPNGEPIIKADNLRLDCNLFSMLGGTTKVGALSLDSPSLEIVENADGTRNLDALLKAIGNKPSAPASHSQTSKPLRLDLKNMAVKNGIIRYVKHGADGYLQTAELGGINVTLDRLMNGQSGKFTASAAFKAAGPSNSVLEASGAATVEFALNQDLLPITLNAKIDHQVSKAEGSFKSLAGFRSEFRGDVTPTEVKEISEHVFRDSQILGEVKLAGPFDLSRKEGHLVLTVGPLDQQFFGPVGAATGIDFGATTLGSVSSITLENAGSLLAVKSQFGATNLSINASGQRTPAIDLNSECDISLDLKNSSARLETLTLDGRQGRKSILHGNLTQPMTVTWAGNSTPANDSAFELAVSELDLPQWRAVVGNAVSAGTFSMNLRVASRNAGKTLNADLKSRITDLAADFGANGISGGAIQLDLNAQIAALQSITLTDCNLSATERGQPVLLVAGSGTFSNGVFAMSSQIEPVMARLLGAGSATPLKLGANLSGAFSNQVLDIKQLDISLPPSERAPRNELRINGQVDLSAPDLTSGNLDIAADSIDLSALYDSFEGQPAPAQKPQSPQTPAEGGNAEPPPMKLPFQFTTKVNLKEVLLREITMRNCQMTAKLDSGKLLLDPLLLTVNDGLVSGTIDLDLGVEGYTYALSLTMDRLPLEPIADTLSPENLGRYKGLIQASAKINGAGVTGASLRKSLTGQATFNLTNAEIQMTGPKLQKIVAPIANLLGLHEILTAPLDWLNGTVRLGDGNIHVGPCVAGSSSFEAIVEGAIPIADVLSNSPLALPVQLSLRRSLAQKVGLAPDNADPGIEYIPIKSIATIKGTLGQPNTVVDKKAVGGVVVNSGVGMAKKVGGQASSGVKSAFSGLRNLFHPKQSTPTNSPATNSDSNR
jgi:uncharacterized protein involved in outer membrane biogenesis